MTISFTLNRPFQGASFPIPSLPEEIQLHIFSYVGVKELYQVQLVSKAFQRIAMDNKLWKELFKSEYGKIFQKIAHYARPSSCSSPDWHSLLEMENERETIPLDTETAAWRRRLRPFMKNRRGFEEEEVHLMPAKTLQAKDIALPPKKKRKTS